jgi:hypothetical protein
MFANFPGFLFSDAGGRQNTNIFRVPPGGGALVKTGGMPLNQAIMPLPYKEPGQAMMNLIQNMVETGQRVGGTAEVAVGEGRADAPVGTTLALIDQATKVMNSVHKRMHAAQAEEFKLLVRCFKENPESFWQKKNKPSYAWDEQTFLAALNDCELVPQADPNTASHTQRIMKIMALKQLQAAQPGLYDPIAIDKAALQAIGWNNPEQFMAPPSAQGKMPPEIQEKIANYQLKQKEVGIKEMEAQARTQKLQADTALDQAKLQFDMQSFGAGGLAEGSKGMSPEELELKKAELQQKADNTQYNLMNSAADARNQEEDRKAKMQIEAMKLENQQARESQQRSHEFDMKRHDAALEQAKMVLAQIAKGGR